MELAMVKYDVCCEALAGAIILRADMRHSRLMPRFI